MNSEVECRIHGAMTATRTKVLVAEDDPVGATILRQLLTQAGYDPIVTRNGREAWEVFDREPARIVVSDWMMPELDGLGLCEKIRSREKTLYTYFILLTANHTSAENFALATTAGVDDFLSKPLSREIMRMRLSVAERILKFTAEIRKLKELIPICVYCRKIRNADDDWERVEVYIQKETGSRFSHGACPECCEKEMADFAAAAAAASTQA